MAGIVTSTAPSATPASLVTLPVSVTGCCAPSRSGAAQSAANKTRTNRRQRTRMFPPPYVCVDGPSSAHESWTNCSNATARRTASRSDKVAFDFFVHESRVRAQRLGRTRARARLRNRARADNLPPPPRSYITRAAAPLGARQWRAGTRATMVSPPSNDRVPTMRLAAATCVFLTAVSAANGQAPASPPSPDPLAARAKGRPDAPVTVYEMSDFQCPYCRSFALTTMPLVEKEYVQTGKVRFVYINLQ